MVFSQNVVQLYPKIWNDLEKFNKEKYPTCIKSILISSGYDSRTSLVEIDEKKICDIEKFVNKYRELTNNLTCCFKDQYQKPGDFSFLPGHVALMMAIPKRIKDMESSKKKSKVPKRIDKKKLTLTDFQLKETLITSLLKYSGKVGYQLPDKSISELNIADFERGSEESGYVCKCQFKCPFCPKAFSLFYKSFWMSSNAATHLKIHIQEKLNDA